MRAAEGIFLFARESLEKVRENHIKVSSIRNITYYTHYYSYYYQYGLTLQLLYINKITNDDDDTGGSSCFVSSCVNPSSFFPCCGAPFQNYYQKNYRPSSSSFSSSSFQSFLNNSIENPPGGGIGMLHAGHGYEYEFGPLSRACVTMCRLASSSHRSHMTCPHLGINVSTFTAKGLPCCTAAACSHAAMPTKSLLCHF